MKNKLSIGLAIAALSLPSLTALAGANDTGTIATGITFVNAGATSNALSTAYVEVKNHEEIAVQWRQVASATNVPAAGLGVITTFGGSMYTTNPVPIATVTNLVSSTDSTTTKNIGANIYLGSYRYFHVISQVNNGTNSIATNTSPTGVSGSINYIFKDKRNGVQ